MKQNQQFTVGLIVAAVALGGYMYFVESKKEAPTDSKDVEIWSLSDNQAADLKTLNINAEGKVVNYTRTGDVWKLDGNTQEVDKSQFEMGYNYLKNLSATRKVEDKPSDPKKYGFQSPNTVVRWGDDNTKFKLEVGDKSPTGDAYFVHALKDDGVYTVATYKIDALKNLASKPPLVAPTPTPAPPSAAPAATGAATPATTAPAPTKAPTAAPVATAKPTPAPTATPKPAATAAPTAAPAATPSPAASK